jgi:hypothetical protein
MNTFYPPNPREPHLGLADSLKVRKSMRNLIVGLTALLFSGLLLHETVYAGSGFEKLSVPGCATSISGGSGPQIWIIGCSRVNASGYGIYSLRGGGWQQVSGAARTIAVSPEGIPWVINEQGAIFKWNFTSREFQSLSVPGCATSIGVGSDDSAWIIGCSRISDSGYGIYSLRGGGWQQVSGAARTIAVSPEGIPWVINEQGAIFKWNGSNFQSVSAPGCATSIGVGPNDSAWIIGCSRISDSGYGIYGLRGNPLQPGAVWQQVSGAARKIAVSSDDMPWVINEQGAIFYYTIRPIDRWK